MTDIGEAALNFIKAVGVIDPQVTSYRDFVDMSPILETYYSLFHKSPEDDDKSVRTRSMVRYLQINVKKDTDIAIDLERLLNLDFDEIEKIAILMFYCTLGDDMKADRELLLEKLDDSDREALIGSEEDATGLSHDSLVKLTASIRELSSYFHSLFSLNQDFDVVSRDLSDKTDGIEEIVANEENKLKQNHSTDRFRLEQIQEEIRTLRESKNETTTTPSSSNDDANSILAPSEDDIERDLIRKETLSTENRDLKTRVFSYNELLKEIDDLRKQKVDMEAAIGPLRQEHQDLLANTEELNARTQKTRAELAAKNEALVEEVVGLKENRDGLIQRLKEYREELLRERTEGNVAQKRDEIAALRRRRDEMKRNVNEVKQRINFLHQSILEGHLMKVVVQ